MRDDIDSDWHLSPCADPEYPEYSTLHNDDSGISIDLSPDDVRRLYAEAGRRHGELTESGAYDEDFAADLGGEGGGA